MRRALTGLFVAALTGCQCGPPADLDAGVDAGPDAGPFDAGPKDGGPDGGPSCSLELCDGIDNDCDGTIDRSADGGMLTQLCPLQRGTCQGAKSQCQNGKFFGCTATDYGAKYEEFESLCDGVDNDCSGFVDVSLWRPIGELNPAGSEDPVFGAASVPGGWYVATGPNGQLFDEQLRPTSDVFPVGHLGAAPDPSAPVAFGGYLNQLFVGFPNPQLSYARRLNLDGTYPAGADGGVLEIGLSAGHSAPTTRGGLTVSNDRSAMLVAFNQLNRTANPAQLLTLQPDGGTRAPLTDLGDAGWGAFQAAAVGAEDFVVALSYPSRLQLQRYSPDLLPLDSSVDLASPGDGRFCALSAHTSATDAGADSVVAACFEQGRLYAAENLFAGGTLTPLWEADAGPITHLRILPSYAQASLFWIHSSTIWLSQLNSPPTPVAELGRVFSLGSAQSGFEVAPSIRGGYLLQSVFDGGQGYRPYGAYVCPP